MSGAGLAVRAVLTMDNTGLVGAAAEGVTSLDALKDAAKRTGAAGVEMGGGIDVAKQATEGLARASASAAAVTQATGVARRQEVDGLVAQAAAGAKASKAFEAMSAAQNAYKSTVTQAAAALKAGSIDHQAFTAIVAGATAKLALSRAGLNEFGKGAEEAEAHTEHLTHEAMHLGRELGITREQMMLFRGSFGAIGELAELLGPIGLIAVGLAAVAIAVAAFAVSTEQAEERSRKLEAELAGIGRMSGVTGAQITQAAHQTASATGESIATTEKWAETYAKTGRIAGQVLIGLTAMTKRYADATGQNAEQASEDLAKSFADPKKGAEELNDKLGALNATQLTRIHQLDAEGDKVGAQKILYAALDKVLDTSATHVRGLAGAWDAVWTAASNAWHQQMIAAGGGTLAEQLAQAKQVLANDTAAAGAVPGGTWYWRAQLAADKKAVDDLTAALAKSTAESNKNSAAAAANAKSVAADAVAREVNPDAFKLDELKEKQARLFAGIHSGAKDSAETLGKMKDAYQAVTDAIGRVTDATGKYIPQATRDHQIAVLQVAEAKARTAAEKGAIETKIKLLQAGSSLITNQQALTQAQDAGAIATAKASHADEEKRKAIVNEIADLAKSVEAERLEAVTAVQSADAAGLSAQARKKLSDQLEVEKGLLVFTALEKKAEKEGFADLIPLIEKAAAAYKKYGEQKNAANEKAAAIQDVKAQYAQLSGAFADVGKQLRDAQQDALDWRNGTIEALGGVANISEEELSRINAIFADKMDKALTDSLEKARDWSSGVQAAMKQMADTTQNQAARAKGYTEELSTGFEDLFVNAVMDSKNALQDFLQLFEKMLLKMIYEIYLEKLMQQLAASITGGLGDIFGGGGYASFGGMSGYGSGPLSGDFGVPSFYIPGLHSGGIAGRESTFTRAMPVSAFSGAPRYHQGVDRVGRPGEVPAILKEGEGVFTPRQMDNANALIAAVLSRPTVVQLPDHIARAANSNEPMQVKVTVHNLDGQTSRAQAKPDGNGGLNVDVIVQQLEQRMAANVQQGKGSLVKTLQQTFGLTRKVAG